MEGRWNKVNTFYNPEETETCGIFEESWYEADRLPWRDTAQMPGAYQRNRNEGEFNLEYTFIAEGCIYFWSDKII